MKTDEDIDQEYADYQREQEQALERANVFYLLCAEYITDAQATAALDQIEAREAV